MVMAEAERAGGGQNDMERELTCSVSFEVAGEEVDRGGRGAAGTSSHELVRVQEDGRFIDSRACPEDWIYGRNVKVKVVHRC
jgi:hypothetical protein